MPTLLSAEGLVHHYRGADGRRSPVLQGIAISVDRGQIVGLVGESGSGKSTLTRLLLGLETPTAGHVFVDGVDLASARGARRRQARSALQPVFQDPVESLDPRLSVSRAIAEPMLVRGTAGKRHERAARVDELLKTVRLSPSLRDRLPHQLSGGERQRVAIARALAGAPKLLLADEPVSALDVIVCVEILDLFASLRRDTGLGLLLVSHDLRVIERVCDEVYVLHLGRVVERAQTQSLFSTPRHPYTSALLAAMPKLAPDLRASSADSPAPGLRTRGSRVASGGCPYRAECATWAAHPDPRCVAEIPELLPISDGAPGEDDAARSSGGAVACHLEHDPATKSST